MKLTANNPTLPSIRIVWVVFLAVALSLTLTAGLLLPYLVPSQAPTPTQAQASIPARTSIPTLVPEPAQASKPARTTTPTLMPEPARAWAAEEAEEAETPEILPMPNIAEFQAKVDEAAAVYDDANRQIAKIEAQMNQTNERILEITNKMPDAKKKSNEAAAHYYRLMVSSNLMLDLLFNASSIGDFFANLEYTARINQSYLNEINSLSNLEAQLKAAKASQEADKLAIEEERTRAEEALSDAQYAKNVAEEVALQIAEQTAAATAAAAAAAEAEAHTPQTPLPPSDKPAESTPTADGGNSNGNGSDGPPPIELPSDKQTFVDEWSTRIDAYLAGSPMAGTGWVFANAAWDYNVDPRWSPAIACLESSKGLYCFKPHNAWGWGSSSWDDWETAIFAHVRGLSIGYGYTISEAAAKKYCPPNADHWFNFVSEQMAKI